MSHGCIVSTETIRKTTPNPGNYLSVDVMQPRGLGYRLRGGGTSIAPYRESDPGLRPAAGPPVASLVKEDQARFVSDFDLSVDRPRRGNGSTLIHGQLPFSSWKGYVDVLFVGAIHDYAGPLPCFAGNPFPAQREHQHGWI